MPLNRRSILILNATGNAMNTTSQAVKGDSYYGYSDGLHTIQLSYNAFAGRVHIQGTLALEPAEADWFDLNPTSTGTSFTTSGTETYVDFAVGSEITGAEAYTFQGNYTHIRVWMDRRHIGDGSTWEASYGQISKAYMSA